MSRRIPLESPSAREDKPPYTAMLQRSQTLLKDAKRAFSRGEAFCMTGTVDHEGQVRRDHQEKKHHQQTDRQTRSLRMAAGATKGTVPTDLCATGLARLQQRFVRSSGRHRQLLSRSRLNVRTNRSAETRAKEQLSSLRLGLRYCDFSFSRFSMRLLMASRDSCKYCDCWRRAACSCSGLGAAPRLPG